MAECLFCETSRTFNIFGLYGSRNRIVDDMLMFFGNQIDGYLKPKDSICHHCMVFFDYIAKIKRRLVPLVYRCGDKEDYKKISLIDIAKALQRFKFDEIPSPCPEMECNKIEYCVPEPQKLEYTGMEAVMARIAKERTQNCYSSQSADKEVAKISKKGRKRKRGHNWYRRKNSRYSSVSGRNTRASAVSTRTWGVTSRTSGVTSRASGVTTSASAVTSCISAQSTRPPSCASVESLESFNPPTPPVTTSHTPNRNVYINSIVPSTAIEINCTKLHECLEPGCTYVCEDIDLMAIHKQTKHKQLLLYFCNYCKKKFTQNIDLDIHLRQHVKQHVCLICKKEFYSSDELTSHWQEHYEKAVVCNYCQKRYKDETVLEKHKIKMHSRNIPSRIDYKINQKGSSSKGCKNEDFSVVMLVQANEKLDGIEDGNLNAISRDKRH